MPATALSGRQEPPLFDRPPPPPIPSFPVRSVDFEQQCCRRFGITRDRYLDTVFAHTLYPHARYLRRVILIFDANFFAADRDFLAGVGRLSRRRDFASEVKDFHHHPANRGLLRRGLRLRVSARRIQTLVNALLTDPPPVTGKPVRLR